MFERETLAMAEAIAREARQRELERTVAAFEQSEDATLRSLARVYRMLRRPQY